ncbi:energy transducer TonB [uncultured Sphingomonas sp.]|uniref:energy transducer TonB n=1 Tax=uncultured Sphingomonas sp. TaxID=158754 RepID=UPI0025D109F1|nr:energy transducer TonB [uncultured Sphingomonas sp.]
MRTIMLAAMLVGQAGGADAPLKPVRSWNMEYADSMCVAARAYGDPAAPITIAFKPTPFGDVLQGVVLGTKKQLGRQARVKIDLLVSGRELGEQQSGTRVHFPNEDRAAITFYFSREAFESLVGASTFTVRAAGSPTISVALSMGKPVLAALRTCETDLLQHFGYDPVKIAAIAKRAEGANAAQWITNDDYPTSALNGNRQGVSFIGWTVSPSGRISDCRVLRSSGTPDLDKAACEAIQKRGRYRPALDAAGNPVESYSTRNVRWLLPD